MVDAVVSCAIETVGNFLNKEGNLLFGVKDRVEEMRGELKWMRCFLKDAERRKGESYLVRNWVSEIRELAYDVEDVIQHFILKSDLRNREGVINVINKYASCINHGAELRQIGFIIEGIKVKLSGLRNSLQNYGIRELSVGGEETPVISRRKRQDYAHIADHNIVCLDEKITEIVFHLLDVEEVPVVCVYGMGGLGKTTTAKQVYSDQRIRGQFEGFAWVYISQQLNQRQVWESILTQLLDKLSDKDKKDIEKMREDELTSQLFRLQKEKKCLIVIDDIWRNQDWVNLSDAAFPYMEKDSRSKILVTSRNKDVVSHGVYRTSLDILDENTCFMLLKNTIGSNHPIKERSEFGKCGEEMVKECGGLPLAIVVLGGILAAKHELNQWERVSGNIRSYLSRGDRQMNGGVTMVLESSYEDLPYHLKSCFLYFSQYREDEEIKRSDLVQKWIGEGFVLPSMGVGEETMEEVGEEYLNELVSRCLVQVGTTGHTGRVNKCRMHDLVRDLCISKAREEGFAQSMILKGEDNDGTNLEEVNCRRLCVSFVGSRFKINKSNVSSLFPKLRSICLHTANEEQRYDGQFRAVKLISKKLKFVRVLEVSHPHWKRIGKLRNLIHLRFLKLEVSVPASSLGLGDMRFLQTLNLSSWARCVVIPNSVWGMEQLRHLYLPRHTLCESSKQRVGNFHNLQTLVNFPPNNFDLQQNLAKFNSVRKLVIGKRIDEIDRIVRSQGILFNRLQSLSFEPIVFDKIHLEAIPRASPRLYRLYCRGLMYSSSTSSCTWPSNLTKLVLDNSELDGSHMGLLAKLQSLRVLFLEMHSIVGKEMIFHENDFPQLCHLKLESLIALEACTVQEGALPSLVCIEIEDCKKLELIVSEESQFLKQLKEIKVKYMPCSFVQRLEGRGRDVFYSNCDMDKYENDGIVYLPRSWYSLSNQDSQSL